MDCGKDGRVEDQGAEPPRASIPLNLLIFSTPYVLFIRPIRRICPILAFRSVNFPAPTSMPSVHVRVQIAKQVSADSLPSLRSLLFAANFNCSF